ncbi:MAG TPA: hypothetical protein VGF55_25770 [Gemmataceae bacterium]|jgi:hypothetical protein
MTRFAIVCAAGLTIIAAGQAAEVPDGIYPLATGGGPRVMLSGGGWATLGPLRTGKWGRAEVRSQANDNARFTVELRGVDPAVDRGEPATVVLVAGGVGLPSFGRSQTTDGKLDLAFTLRGEEEARKVAAALKTEPILRKHPGHRVVLKLAPDREAYRPGEPVTLTVDICNVGDVPVLFRMGGRQRGARDNQFRFLAYGWFGLGKAVPDTGDPNHHGGLTSLRPLKPGESIRQTVPLNRWFRFTASDTYRVTGLYELELHDMPERFLRTTIWEDLAVGECLIKVVATDK